MGAAGGGAGDGGNELSTYKYADAKLPDGHPMLPIIQDAYREFAGPRPASTDVCECCTDPQIQSELLRLPVEDIPTDYIRDWYSGAYDPAGVSKGTWSHLLPRILEILAADEDASSIGPEVTLSRFDTGNAANWSPRQWNVLDRFQRAFLIWAVENRQDDFDAVLCMFRLGGWPLDDLLSQAAALPTSTLVERFWKDWCADHVAGRESVWVTTFWEGDDNSTVFDFYTSPDMHHRVSELALADETPPTLRGMAIAVATIIENQATWIGR